MNIPQESLETALRNHGRATTVQRVISMKAESALPKGENYLSTIYRITLKVVLGNGRIATRSLILKVVPPEAAKTELVKDMGVFKSETMMYTIVLREMEALMEEFNDTNDVLWCRLLHYEPYTSLLLEDLKAGGFRMTRRQDCLDLEHSLLVLRSLGRFHAMAKILEQRGIVVRTDYKPYPLTNDKNLIKFFMYYGLQTLSKAMEESWGPEWYDVAQKLKIPCDVLMEKMAKLGEVDDTRFNCLNHGDCWSNNMMFKYDWQNRPYTMRFVDLQLVHIGSYAFDISYAMYTTFDPITRRKNYVRFCKEYSAALKTTLEFFGYTGYVPTSDDVIEELERVKIFALHPLIIIHAVVTNDEDTLEMEEILRSKGKKGHNPLFYNNKFKDECGADLIEIAEKLAEESLVDLQMCHYQSPVFDLIYFMNTSIFPETRRQNRSLILENYVNSLNSTLDFYGYEGKRLTMETLEQDLEHFSWLSIFSIVWVAAVIQTYSEEHYDLDLVLKSAGTEGLDTGVYDETFRQRYGPDIKYISKLLNH